MVRIDCGDTGPWVWGPLLPHPLCQSKQWKWRVGKLGPGGRGLRCEGYQCNKVPGVFSSEVPTAAEDNEGDEEDGIGDIIGPDVLLDEALHLPDEREHGHSGQSHGQLQSQHQEHLRRELLRALPSAAAPPPSPRPTFRMKAWRMLLSSQLVAGKSWLS